LQANKDALAFRSKVHHFMLMIDWTQCPAVERIPGKVSGAWLFKDCRVPVKALFENIEGGATVQEFLEWFPGVQRAQIDAVAKALTGLPTGAYMELPFPPM
jgi:uncharacterized protein (DUF433 family)